MKIPGRIYSPRFKDSYKNTQFCLILGLGLLFFLAPSARAEDWTAPAWADTIKAPAPPDSSSLSLGKKTFRKNCAACHGISGGGDGPMNAGMMPGAPVFNNYADMAATSDGELYWRITTGKKPMPTWKGQLTEEQIWAVIGYLRSLSHPPLVPDSLRSAPVDSQKP
jgi:mono/diheme cytochrome c family protein